MKVNETWLSVDAVINSFQNVSIMGNSNRNDDIFAASPPKHRISPSQLELFENMGGYSTRRSPTMGRGKRLTDLSDKIAPGVRDKALFNDIRFAQATSYSNAKTEEYFNRVCNTNASDLGSFEDITEDSKLSETSLADSKSIDLDQVSVNSSLNVNAKEFCPLNVNVNDEPNSFSCYDLDLDSVSQRSSPSKRKSKVGLYGVNSRVGKNEKYKHNYREEEFSRFDKKSDSHIGFSSSCFENDSDDEVNSLSNEKLSDSSSFPISSSSPVDVSSSSSKYEETPPVELPQTSVTDEEETSKLPTDEEETSKLPRPRRVMKNALFMSLNKKQQSPPPIHLQKPEDFIACSNLPSSSTTTPVTFVTTESEANCSNDSHYLAKPYDFMADPGIDSESKDLILSLTSSPSSSSSPSLVTKCSNSSSPSKKSKSKSKGSSKSSSKTSSPKPLSYYDYSYNPSEFPPL